MKTVYISIVVAWQTSSAKVEIFLQRRNEDGPLDGLLEFPGGKIEKGESSLDAAKREFIEETEVHPSASANWQLFKSYKHTYSDRQVDLTVILLRDQTLSSKLTWVDIETINNDDIPEANHQIIKDLKEKFL